MTKKEKVIDLTAKVDKISDKHLTVRSITFSFFVILFNFDSLDDDAISFNGKLYYHNDDNWSGTDGNDVQMSFNINNSFNTVGMGAGEINEWNRVDITNHNGTLDYVVIDVADSTRKPQAGATVYVKDICVEIYR
jgi:hypothetical protein